MNPVKLALVASAAILAGCVADPINQTIGKPHYTRIADNKVVPITDPALQPVRQGCKARYESIRITNGNLYGSASWVFATDEIDDLKNCFYRHGYRLAYQQPSGKLTPYAIHDKRLDY